MPKIKPIGYDEFTRKLMRAGYVPVRKSKHTIYFHPQKQITIPLPHKHQKDMSKGFIHKLIKEMKLSTEEFNQL
ncbi:MAG: type II toxin-antitoxin system HicA family toxin [Candidatus Terrybacteria bacterium]|nr:type II toxin-antitoxin system HicA family toxin [Candidatus Terrybacteria bacterium]